MKVNELEELQEEAHATYHQGDYSATASALERVVEVGGVRRLVAFKDQKC